MPLITHLNFLQEEPMVKITGQEMSTTIVAEGIQGKAGKLCSFALVVPSQSKRMYQPAKFL
jgi:hypothetical protein